MATIGAGIVVNGRISGSETVAVFGRVEGTVSLTDVFRVEEGGVVVADVDVKSLIVRGALSGNVVAHEVITLQTGCAVTGNLRAPRIIIEEGARFKGNIDMDVPNA